MTNPAIPADPRSNYPATLEVAQRDDARAYVLAHPTARWCTDWTGGGAMLDDAPTGDPLPPARALRSEETLADAFSDAETYRALHALATVHAARGRIYGPRARRKDGTKHGGDGCHADHLPSRRAAPAPDRKAPVLVTDDDADAASDAITEAWAMLARGDEHVGIGLVLALARSYGHNGSRSQRRHTLLRDRREETRLADRADANTCAAVARAALAKLRQFMDADERETFDASVDVWRARVETTRDRDERRAVAAVFGISADELASVGVEALRRVQRIGRRAHARETMRATD